MFDDDFPAVVRQTRVRRRRQYDIAVDDDALLDGCFLRIAILLRWLAKIVRSSAVRFAEKLRRRCMWKFAES